MSKTPIGPIKQGDSLRLDFVVQAASGAAVSLTGSTITWTLSPVTNRTAPVLTKPASITDAAAGKCSVMIDAGDLATAGTYFHELEVILVSGESITPSDGTFTVTETNRPIT